MCLLDLLASLRADRPSWSLSVLLGDDGPLRAKVTALGVACDVLPMPARLAALGDAGVGLGARGGGRLALAARGPGAALAASSYVSRLKSRLRAEAPALIQSNGMKAHVLAAWAAPRGVPVVWHLHDYVGSRPVMARLLRWSSRKGVSAVAVSNSVADDARRVLGPSVAVEAVYNAVDLARFAPGASDGAWLDAAAGLPPADGDMVRVGLVATFARWKGHEVFLDAVARLPRDLPARYYIIGGPLYRSAGSQYSADELRSKAEARGLAGRVGFAGHQAEPSDVYRALDVVVHASTRPEPFGRVIVEAMACGKAVVVSPIGGAAELFEDGTSALASAPGHADDLAALLARLIGDADLRQRLGAAGRAAAEARFDRAHLAPAWSRIYAGALA